MIDLETCTPQKAYLYARDVLKGRWFQAEHLFLSDPRMAYWYARVVIKGRWFEAEHLILSADPKYANLYKSHFGILDI